LIGIAMLHAVQLPHHVTRAIAMLHAVQPPHHVTRAF